MNRKDTRWKPGKSGNPTGRPVGSGTSGKLRAEISKEVPGILKKLAEQAREGDVQSARLLLERVLPPLKPAEEPLPVTLAADDNLSAQGRAVLAAMSGADLAPGQAAQLLAALASLAKLIETDELSARVAALEAKDGKPANQN